MNILIVDDDQLVSLSIKTILEATTDINIWAVGKSGQEAIELYREYKPDVLLMDIRMEGMTGLEAGRLIMKELWATEAHHRRIRLYGIQLQKQDFLRKNLRQSLIKLRTANGSHMINSAKYMR